MSTLTILRGLPASGKSTKAKEIIEKSGNIIRLNKGLLRSMLHFDKWSGYNEGITRDIERLIAKEYLKKGNVIIDDTNLNNGTLQSWKDLGKELNVKVEVIEIDTPFDVCIERDINRPNSVGRDVIIGMAMKSGVYPAPKKGIVICDIDGTLADISKRIKFAKGEEKDWSKFFSLIHEDEIRTEVLDQVLKLESDGYEIFLVSGRPEKYREITELWFEGKCNGYKFYKALFMRKNSDKREDTIIKKEIYDSYFSKYSVYKVFDDRPRIIRMWQEQGLDVIDVGNGIDF